MFEKVIVGVDGGEGGEDALALGRLLSGDDAALTLVSIYPREPVAWRGASADYQQALREEAARTVEEARKASGVTAEARTHGAHDVGRGLHEVAEELGADLIVVGSSRKGHIGRVFSGDDTRHALNGAVCAVAVAPTGYSRWDAGLQKIGVGYDGSPESEQALAFARDLARDRNATVAAMEVLYFEMRYFVGPAWPDRSTMAGLMEDARKRIAKFEGVEPYSAAGVPAEELARFSDGLDLLVVGSRGYGPHGRLVYGSVAGDLARTARSPLIVLPRAAAEHKAARPEAGVASAGL